jgi:hypothetical protein
MIGGSHFICAISKQMKWFLFCAEENWVKCLKRVKKKKEYINS